MGQFSVTIYGATGSALSDIQHNMGSLAIRVRLRKPAQHIQRPLRFPEPSLVQIAAKVSNPPFLLDAARATMLRKGLKLICTR